MNDDQNKVKTDGNNMKHKGKTDGNNKKQKRTWYRYLKRAVKLLKQKGWIGVEQCEKSCSLNITVEKDSVLANPIFGCST